MNRYLNYIFVPAPWTYLIANKNPLGFPSSLLEPPGDTPVDCQNPPGITLVDFQNLPGITLVDCQNPLG